MTLTQVSQEALIREMDARELQQEINRLVIQLIITRNKKEKRRLDNILQYAYKQRKQL
jgi:hypothetical protein